MTGADSPVIADSSTEAMPSMISPSEGMRSPASQTTRSPHGRSAAGTSSSRAVGSSRRASVSERIRRSVSACALPRPSAIASAKLAKITVRKSQIGDRPGEDAGVRDRLDEGDDRPDEHDEHHRVLHLDARVELAEGLAERLARISRSNRLRASATPCAVSTCDVAAVAGVRGLRVVVPSSWSIRRTFRD